MPADSADWQWSSDVAAADWIRDGLHGFAVNVGSVIPDRFAAYARVFHPARNRDAGKVRWADIAAWSGRVLHSEMQFQAIAQPIGDGRGEAPWDGENPRDGVLAPDEAEVLVEVLGRYTSTQAGCWFCLWDGYGDLHGGAAVGSLNREGEAVQRPRLVPPEIRAGPRVRLPGRDYFLYRGPIYAALAFCARPFPKTPNLWWPDDRAWCVASEIDFFWTYVGGSSELIEQLLRDDHLEALRASITDEIQFDGDHLNS